MTTIKILDLIKMLDSGINPTVEFVKTKEFEEIDVGMRAMVIGYTDDGDDCYSLKFDFSKFAAINDPLMKPVFSDRKGEYHLTAKESGWWKDVNTYYVMGKQGGDDDMLKVIGNSSLFDEYLASGVDNSYVNWLESLVIKGRNNG